jgi:hypothetical protein
LAGWQQGRWQPAAAPVRCACRGLLPGGGGHARRRTTLEASEGAREGAGVEGRRWFGAEGGVRRRRRLCRPADRKRRGRRVPVRFQGGGKRAHRRRVVECSAWPAGPACMRATHATAACDGTWPGGPATGSQTRAWARCSGPRVRRSTHGGAGPPRRLRGGRTPEAWATSRSGARVRASRHQFQLRFAFFQIAKLQKVPTKLKISKKQSCRGAIDLQLSQRATYVLINGLPGNVGRSCSFSTARVTVHGAVKPIFGQFAL